MVSKIIKNIIALICFAFLIFVGIKYLKERSTNKPEEVMKEKIEKSNKVIFAFLSAPGAGKGTLAEKCVNELGYITLSTGNLFRENIANKTELGNQASEYIKQGNLVPDELTTNMVKEWLISKKDLDHPIILDGFPRTIKQAELLNQILAQDLPDFKLRIISLQIPEEEIVARLSNRRVCPNNECQAVYNLLSNPPKQEGICDKCDAELIKRADDDENVIRERFKVYEEKTAPLINFYNQSESKVETLDVSNLTPNQVFEKFKDIK